MNICATSCFDTVVDALAWLRNKEFSHDFGSDLKYTEALIATRNDFTVDYVFRFDGYTDPADEHILYAIRSDNHGLKGIMLSAFGVYADTVVLGMVSRMLHL